MSFKTYLGIAVFVGGAAAIFCAADFIFGKKEMYAKDYALIKVRSKRPQESWDIINSVGDAVKKSEEVFAREQKIANEAIKGWKESSGYSNKMTALERSKNLELKELRKTFNLDSKKADIFAEADKAIANFKESIGYDNHISELNRSISEAENAYELQKSTLKLTCNGNDTLYDNMKEAAKKAKKEIVETAKKGIDNLNKQVTDRTVIINADRDRKIADISAELVKQEKLVVNKFDPDISALNNELRDKISEINADVLNTRSEADTNIVINAKRLAMESEDIRAAERMVAEDVYREMSNTEKIAVTLKMTEWKEWQFILAAAVPVIAVFFGVGVYCSKVVEIVKCMRAINI